MLRIGRFLEVNRSLDGSSTGARWYRLPLSDKPRISLMQRRRLSPEYFTDAKSQTPSGAAGHRVSGRILF